MKLAIKELRLFMDDAASEFISIPHNSRLVGMKRPLDNGEQLGVSYLLASIQHLKRIGALDPAWDGTLEYEIVNSRTGG